MRLLANLVLVEPIDERTQVSAGGLLLVNHHRKTELKFRVLAVGPGGWRVRKKKRVFIAPEVEPGDLILSRALMEDGIIKHSYDDGTGRLIIHATGILMKWRE